MYHRLGFSITTVIIGIMIIIISSTAVGSNQQAINNLLINKESTQLDFLNKSVFPTDNIWNKPIDNLPIDTHSADYINKIGATTGLHPDFSNASLYGIPFCVIDKTQPKVPIIYTDYPTESDPGPFPIPPTAPVENGSDRHVLVVDKDTWMLYELYNAYKLANNSWNASSGAKFNLSSNVLRPDTWTSADAAGLPIFPGLVTYDEVKSGKINHALRFTVPTTQKSSVWPARHFASSTTDPTYPPMGERFRLKPTVNISSYTPDVKVILTALKTYGMMVADNGGAWYISGAPDSRWDDSTLHTINNIKGSDFEAVNVTSLMVNIDSGQVISIVIEYPIQLPCIIGFMTIMIIIIKFKKIDV